MSNYEFWDELGKIFNAVVAYQEKTVEFNKRFINPWIRLGNVFDKQDRNDEAVDAYQKALEIDPKNAQNWYEVGNIHFRMGKYDEAISAFNQAIELDSGFGWPYSNLALTYVSQGKFVEAIPLYRKSIDLLKDDKDKAVAWNRLGNVYRKLNEYEQAVESFQRADELDQENAGFRDNLDEQTEGPTLVEAGAEHKDGSAVPVTLSLSELIPPEPQAAEDVPETTDRPAPAVEASAETPTAPDEVIAEEPEALGDADQADAPAAEVDAIDDAERVEDMPAVEVNATVSEPVASEAEASATAAEEAVDQTALPSEVERPVPEDVVAVSEESAVENETLDPQPAVVDAESSAAETVDEVSIPAEADQQAPADNVEVMEQLAVENEASDPQPDVVDAESSVSASVEAIDEASAFAEVDQQVPVDDVEVVVEQPAVENEASDSQAAALDAEFPAAAPAEEVSETSESNEAEQQGQENTAELSQEPEAETAVASADEVAAIPEAADAGIENEEAAPGDETVTIVVQSTVETFTETVTISDTATETSDSALAVETMEEAVSEPAAQDEEVVVENAVRTSEPEQVEASTPTVDETGPVEAPSAEAAELEVANVDAQTEAEEPVAEITTAVAEVEVSVDQDANTANEKAGEPASDQPAYEEFLKDSDDPIHIYESASSEDSTQGGNVPASQEPIAKIDSAGDVEIEMDTKNALVWNELGNVYFNTGAYDDAVVAYSKAIELDRWFAWPYSNLALTYVQKGRFVEAILLYQRSIELFNGEKDKAISWNRLGNVYRRINDYENAIAAYQRADDLDPDNTSLSLQSRFSLLGSYVMEQKPSYVS
jgi:tetratricopeptide (TPR) repeat protein